ncbi:MAG TPA: amidohydrolase family protein, partial [Ktedonobacterales bacterium]|nr:amidohydrolase family protein [Ktedonobacterales bacterium]
MAESATLRLRGSRIIEPSLSLDGPGEVVIADGRVAAMGDASAVAATLARLDAEGQPARTIDLPPGWVLAPGFVDLHAHLREPGFEAKETIATGTRAAARGGFTTLCCMPNTQPVLDSQAALELVRRAAEGAPARV